MQQASATIITLTSTTGVSQVGKLNGPFRGFRNEHTRFTFSNGAVWRQNETKYFYFYAANPRARVIYQNGIYLLEIDGTDETVQVIREGVNRSVLQG